MHNHNITKSAAGFTLVEIMIVVAIIALLATIAVPSFLRARKRSQATKLVNDARILEAAIDQWAIEKNQTEGTIPEWSHVNEYIKKTSLLWQNSGGDIFGNFYTGPGGAAPSVGGGLKVNQASYNTVQDVTEAEFWGSYAP